MAMMNSKVFLMDKYFTEMEKLWRTQDSGKDGSANQGDRDLQRRLHSLSLELEVLDPGPQTQQETTESMEAQSWSRPSTPPIYENACMFQLTSSPKKGIWNSYSSSNLTMYTDLEDMIHLPGPLTEDSVLKTLQARFYKGHFCTWIGPVLVLVNPNTETPPPRALDPPKRPCQHLLKVTQTAVRQQLDTGHSQVICLNGISGSGKTHTMMQLLRQLFDVAGGGPETDSFKHLRAAFTVLRSLGSAATVSNPHSSRMGYFIESHITDGAIYRTKIHCYFLDQARITKPAKHEKNYSMFYELLAGLSAEERAKFHLTSFSPLNLRYLSGGNVSCDPSVDQEYFLAWKKSLAVLGIPFSDILRVLAAILLLGNVQFVEGAGLEVEVQGNSEIKSVSSLLGVSPVSLYRALTTRTKRSRGQVFKSLADAATANFNKDCLAKALYSRSVYAIVRRANSCKRPTTNSAVSDSSNDSGSQDGRSHNTTTDYLSTGHRNSANTNSFVGILDMFGYEDNKQNELEQLCINFCAEKLQQYYNDVIFRDPMVACMDEGIQANNDCSFFDNSPIVNVICAPQTGVLCLLEAEGGLQRGNTESFLQKVRVQHSRSKHFFEPEYGANNHFGIIHYGSRISYDATNFLAVNKDQMPDDVVCMFSKQSCNFGFISHLFNLELRAISERGDGPCGASFRASPSMHVESVGSEQQESYTGDFRGRLDHILQVLRNCKPHFIRCIKSNTGGAGELFERELVVRQLRSLQLLETVHIMSGGFPHKIRYKTFIARYRLLLPSAVKRNKSHGSNNNGMNDSKAGTGVILDQLLQLVDDSSQMDPVAAHWALGKKHLFMSEPGHQQLEKLRLTRLHQAATLIQAHWRCRMCRKKWPLVRKQLIMAKHPPGYDSTYQGARQSRRPRRNSMIDTNDIPAEYSNYKGYSIYGLDMERPPPVPSSRTYTVMGNMKMGFPQMRIMKSNYTVEDSVGEMLLKGQEVKVIGSSSRRGYLLVEYGLRVIQVPYHVTEIRTSNGIRPRSSSTSRLPGMDV